MTVLSDDENRTIVSSFV